MLGKARKPSPRLLGRRSARLMTAVILCALPGTLAVADESGAATPATGAVGSVVTTATHELSSTAPVTTAPVTPAASSPAPTATAPVTKIATPTTAAVESAAAATTSTARDAGPVPARALNGAAAAVTSTVSHVARSTSGVTHDAGSAVSTATTAVTHTVNRAAGASNLTHTITQVAQASSRVVTHAVTQAVSTTAGSPVLTGTTNTVAGVARSTSVAGVAAGLIPTATGAVKGTSGATATTTITAALTRGGSNGPRSSADRGPSTPAPMKQVPAASVTSPSSGSSFEAGPSPLATPTSSAQAVFHGASGPAIALQPLSGAPSALLGQSVWMTLSTLPADSALASGTGAPGTGVGVRPATTPVAPPEHAPPSPGGASPATAAGTGSGLSIFPILAGLLMLAVPWAKRRLRLASEPWRLAPFVLIPERPG